MGATTGAESGHGARPMNLEWVRQIRDDCASGGATFFFKHGVPASALESA